MGDLIKDADAPLANRENLIVVYSSAGVGKTSLLANACKAENGLMILAGEDGLSPLIKQKKELEGIKKILIAGKDRDDVKANAELWATFQDYLKQVIVTNHPFKILAIDSFTTLVNIAFDPFIACKYFSGSMDKANAYKAKMQWYIEEMGRILQAFDLILAKGIPILISCHSVVINYKSPTEEDYKKFSIALPGNERIDLSSDLINRADAVLFAAVDITVEDHKAIGNRRILKCDTNPAYISKNRLGLPEKMLLDYTVLKNALKPKPKAESVAVKA
jgi:hypothetical protein